MDCPVSRRQNQSQVLEMLVGVEVRDQEAQRLPGTELLSTAICFGVGGGSRISWVSGSILC